VRHGLLAAQVQDRLARDTFEQVFSWRRGLHFAAADDEDVVSRALGDVAAAVEHDRLGDARVVRLNFREDVVEVVQALDARAKRVGNVAHDRRRDDRDALGVHLLRVSWIRSAMMKTLGLAQRFGSMPSVPTPRVTTARM
jgi:hypothetical protein